MYDNERIKEGLQNASKENRNGSEVSHFKDTGDHGRQEEKEVEMVHVKTVAEAQALPEESYISWEHSIDPVTHFKVQRPIVRAISAVGVDDDDIIMFHDTDGRLMRVIGVDGHLAKQEV